MKIINPQVTFLGNASGDALSGHSLCYVEAARLAMRYGVNVVPFVRRPSKNDRAKKQDAT